MNLLPISISFIVPALNEEKIVGAFIEQLMDQLLGKVTNYQVILVNDGSSDKTGEIMDSAAERYDFIKVVHNSKNIGFGNSFQRGLTEATNEYIMLLCGDGGLPATSLPSILKEVGSADIVIPWIENLKEIKSPVRYYLSRAYSKILNILFGISLNYYNGLAVHKRYLLNKISIKSGGFGFQAEIIVKLIKSGCTYIEIPVIGAEEKGKSVAMRPRNWISVIKTLLHLLKEIYSFKAISRN